MELKDFIKAAITDITDAISELQNELKNGAVVSPSMPDPIALKTVKTDGANRLITNIDFDVAITVGNIDSFNGNVKAGIQIFAAKVSGGNEARTENVSRMTFSVPVIFPTAEVKTDVELRDESAFRKLQESRPKDRSCVMASVEASQADSPLPNSPIHTT